MQVSFDAVAHWFEGILSGTASREEAHRWAAEIVEAESEGALDCASAADEMRIWVGVIYLFGADVADQSGAHLYSLENLREVYDELRRDGDAS